jgi:hypothetical protein
MNCAEKYLKVSYERFFICIALSQVEYKSFFYINCFSRRNKFNDYLIRALCALFVPVVLL